MKNLAIIPARANSRRLPGKNVKSFGGVPLFVHSINYAKENMDILDDIIVTTDDIKVKNISGEHGINVLERPSELSRDTSSTLSVISHVIERMGDEYENFFILQPTNPLRPKKMLSKAYSEYLNSYDSLFTVSQNHCKLGKIINNRFVPFNYEFGQRSQEIEPLYFENGLLYIVKKEVVLSNRLMGDRCLPFIVDHIYAHVDIDTEQDFVLGEKIFNIKHSI